MSHNTGRTAVASSTGGAGRARPFPEAAGAAALVTTVAAAACLICIVWATYAAFDRKSFDLQTAVAACSHNMSRNAR